MATAKEDLDRAAEFHGHICPGLAYGVRVARAALALLGDRAADEELVVVAETDSCMVDAVQVLAGCTFGKGNLVYRDTGKSVFTFFRRGAGPGVEPAGGTRISVDFERSESPKDEETWGRFLSGDRSPDVVKRIEDLKRAKVDTILAAPEEQILRITTVAEPVPKKARIFPSVRCSRCGEKVMEPRVRLAAGHLLCIPCFERT